MIIDTLRQVFHYKTNPARAILVNFIIKIKGKRKVEKITLIDIHNC